MKPVGITVQKVTDSGTSARSNDVRRRPVALSALDKDELTDIIDGVKKVSESLSWETSCSAVAGFGGIGGIGASATPATNRSSAPRCGTSDAGLDSSGFEACFEESTFEGTRRVC
jgi:hypothetical protein